MRRRCPEFSGVEKLMINDFACRRYAIPNVREFRTYGTEFISAYFFYRHLTPMGSLTLLNDIELKQTEIDTHLLAG